jgi:hypothetical protein
MKTLLNLWNRNKRNTYRVSRRSQVKSKNSWNNCRMLMTTIIPLWSDWARLSRWSTLKISELPSWSMSLPGLAKILPINKGRALEVQVQDCQGIEIHLHLGPISMIKIYLLCTPKKETHRIRTNSYIPILAITAPPKSKLCLSLVLLQESQGPAKTREVSQENAKLWKAIEDLGQNTQKNRNWWTQLGGTISQKNWKMPLTIIRSDWPSTIIKDRSYVWFLFFFYLERHIIQQL